MKKMTANIILKWLLLRNKTKRQSRLLCQHNCPWNKNGMKFSLTWVMNVFFKSCYVAMADIM